MSKTTIKTNDYSKKTMINPVSSTFYSYILIMFFITATNFAMAANENSNVSDATDIPLYLNEANCMLSVDAGDDVELCEETEVILSASISGQSQCNDCIEYGIENTERCGKGILYVLWLKDDNNNIVRRFRNDDLEWKELADGTATLKGTVVDNNDSQITLEVDVTYTGRTTVPPVDSPKEHLCNTEDSTGWIYYTDVTGTISSTDGSWSFDISRMGPAFQLGNGANITEEEVGKYGASGWFNTTDSDFTRGDFNINIGNCIVTETSEVTYLWSTGETTPTITVNTGGTYTVTVKDCEDCEASDSVDVVLGNPITVNAGEDQQICPGQEATLVAEVDGAEECEQCIEYGITDTEMCTGNGEQYVLWLQSTTAPNRFFSNIDLVWNEGNDGTASLKGTVYNSQLDQNYEVDVTFTGGTTAPPTTESPKDHFCYNEDATSWTYYPNYSGTITSEDGSWSTNISRVGPAFQSGNGANTNEMVEGRNGASGWFETTNSEYTFGDFNINFGDCILSQSSGIEYLWSTGETTKSIIVSPGVETTYSVTVRGCNDCGSATDEVVVSLSGLTVDIQLDAPVCLGQSYTITSPIEGDSYLWSTGETTQSISIFVVEPAVYTLEVTKDGCIGMGEIDISPIICEGRGNIDVFPTVLKPSDDLSLSMKSDHDQKVTISLHDLSGSSVGPVLVKKMPKGQSMIKISLAQFSKISTGMYILLIEGNKTTSRMVIIE